MKTAAILISEPGGPEAMLYGEAEIPEPGPDEVLLRHTAIGVNFIDVYHRTGFYPLPERPFTPGLEAAGVVERCGARVEGLKAGQRVAYASPPIGAYAQRRLMPASRLVPLPEEIDDRTAAAIMTKGLTAEYLLTRTYPVKAGQTILVHAAAGGVGTILCQWARHIGASVIGTVGSEQKAEIAARNGCTYPIVYTREDFRERVMEITGGKGVPVVYDSVGQSTFEKSLDCLSRRGTMVSFGQSSGPVPPLDIGILSRKGSLYLTRPTILHYTEDRAELLAAAEKLFGLVKSGAIRIEPPRAYPLAEAAEAHRALEGRKTTGSVILLP